MNEFPSNSHKSKEEQRLASLEKQKVEKVIRGQAKTKKKTELGKIASNFVSEDFSTIKSYILMDVLIPSAKKAISDIIKNGIDMLLYGGSSGQRKTGVSDRVSYRSYYDNNREPSRSYSSTRSSYDYDEIILDSRGEAEAVLARMDELIDTYRQVTVADMYELVGISCPHTYNNYGWKNIRNAEVVRVRDGYLIKMPRAEALR